ncbi:collagen alpha-1(X) chain-like isoform X3 [Argopecten irradians]|uniref:collagen alpha-1(X) chain-like isoform X3 n=1 Tax=Argopecten irradians TaxID=31199 RepID=UPI0037104BB9
MNAVQFCIPLLALVISSTAKQDDTLTNLLGQIVLLKHAVQDLVSNLDDINLKHKDLEHKYDMLSDELNVLRLNQELTMTGVNIGTRQRLSHSLAKTRSTLPVDYTGQKGAKGEPGPKGDSGMPGFNGDDGIDGQKGEKGDPGRKGDSGMPGFNGDDGLDGQKGTKGDIGLPGPIGLKGNIGTLGPRGPQGIAGPKGDQGIPGQVGQKGTSGIPGKSGSKGMTGPMGPQGAAGIHGKIGTKGDQGVPGKAGQKGNSGTNGLPGQPGAKGMPGPIGPKGTVGMPGKNGPKGDQGIPGSPGQKGNPGMPGISGPPGTKGMQGQLGYPGVPGLMGPKGDPGEGPPGLMGQKGEAGTQGPRGFTGPKGMKGDTCRPGELSEARIAFSARIKSDLVITNIFNEKILFDDVKLNIGSSYSTSGIFVCPVTGLYVFTWSTEVSSAHTLTTLLLVNGQERDRLHVQGSSANWNIGSATILVHLSVTDQVHIEAVTTPVGTIIGTYSSFTGFFLRSI